MPEAPGEDFSNVSAPLPDPSREKQIEADIRCNPARLFTFSPVTARAHRGSRPISIPARDRSPVFSDLRRSPNRAGYPGSGFSDSGPELRDPPEAMLPLPESRPETSGSDEAARGAMSGAETADRADHRDQSSR